MPESYRIVVAFDPERSVFVARAPELEACVAEAATRAEAVAKVEEEIAAVVANVTAQGGRVPEPLDVAPVAPGPLTVKVSEGLRRELAFQARLENVELDALAGELLAAALEARRLRGRGRPAEVGDRGPRPEPGQERGPDRGQDRGPRGPGGFGRRGEQSSRYHDIMEDRASFVEYVRQLESGGRPQGGRGPGGQGQGGMPGRGQAGGRGPGPGRGPQGGGQGGGGRGPGG